MNILIYPYDDGVFPFLKYLNKNNHYILLTPSWRKITISLLDSIENYQLVTEKSASYDEITFDLCWIVDSDTKCEEYIIKRILENAKNDDKKVVITRRMSKNEYDIIKSTIKLENLQISDNIMEFKKLYEDTQEYILDINIPIIMVTGIIPSTEKTKIQLLLYEELKERNYKPALFCTNANAFILGEESAPNVFFDGSLNSRKLIKHLNLKIKQIELTKKPDIIIVGVPQSYHIDLKVSQNDFGNMLFCYTKAVRPDFLIATMMYDYYKFNLDEGYDGYLDDVVRLSSCEVDAVCISKRRLLIEESEFINNVQFLTLDSSAEKLDLSKNDLLFFNTFEDVKQIVDKLEQKLTVD